MCFESSGPYRVTLQFSKNKLDSGKFNRTSMNMVVKYSSAWRQFFMCKLCDYFIFAAHSTFTELRVKPMSLLVVVVYIFMLLSQCLCICTANKSGHEVIYFCMVMV